MAASGMEKKMVMPINTPVRLYFDFVPTGNNLVLLVHVEPWAM